MWRTTRATDTNGRHGAKAASLLGRFTREGAAAAQEAAAARREGGMGLSGRPLPSDK